MYLVGWHNSSDGTSSNGRTVDFGFTNAGSIPAVPGFICLLGGWCNGSIAGLGLAGGSSILPSLNLWPLPSSKG
jgi:hypothetical protein